MSETNILEFKKKIIKLVTAVPGLVGFANPNAKKVELLKDDKMIDGIEIIETIRGFEAVLHLISSTNVRAEMVAKEITSAIKFLCQKDKIKMGKVNIFIRGVK